MSLEYSDRICPFWIFGLRGKRGCLVSDEFCSFNYAKDRFINCVFYLSEIQKKIKKHKRAIKGG